MYLNNLYIDEMILDKMSNIINLDREKLSHSAIEALTRMTLLIYFTEKYEHLKFTPTHMGETHTLEDMAKSNKINKMPKKDEVELKEMLDAYDRHENRVHYDIECEIKGKKYSLLPSPSALLIEMFDYMKKNSKDQNLKVKYKGILYQIPLNIEEIDLQENYKAKRVTLGKPMKLEAVLS